MKFLGFLRLHSWQQSFCFSVFDPPPQFYDPDLWDKKPPAQHTCHCQRNNYRCSSFPVFVLMVFNRCLFLQFVRRDLRVSVCLLAGRKDTVPISGQAMRLSTLTLADLTHTKRTFAFFFLGQKKHKYQTYNSHLGFGTGIRKQRTITTQTKIRL